MIVRIMLLIFFMLNLIWLCTVGYGTYLEKKQLLKVAATLTISTIVTMALPPYTFVILIQSAMYVALLVYVYKNTKSYFLAIFIPFIQYILISFISVPSNYLVAKYLPEYTIDRTFILILTGLLLLEFTIFFLLTLLIRRIDRTYNILFTILSYPKKNPFSTFSLYLFFAVFSVVHFGLVYVNSLSYLTTYVFFLLIAILLIISNYYNIRYRYQYQQLAIRTNYLKSIQEEIDMSLGIQHDINNILYSLAVLLREARHSEALNYITEVTGYLDKDVKLSMYGEINKILSPPFQGALISKIGEMEGSEIPFQLSVNATIAEFHVNPLDFIRCANILLDNAIEYSKTIENPLITIDLRRESQKIMFTIENKIENASQINLKTITRKGYSLKEGHSGRGLWIISKITGAYLNFDYQILVSEHTFKVTLTTHKV